MVKGGDNLAYSPESAPVTNNSDADMLAVAIGTQDTNMATQTGTGESPLNVGGQTFEIGPRNCNESVRVLIRATERVIRKYKRITKRFYSSKEQSSQTPQELVNQNIDLFSEIILLFDGISELIFQIPAIQNSFKDQLTQRNDASLSDAHKRLKVVKGQLSFLLLSFDLSIGGGDENFSYLRNHVNSHLTETDDVNEQESIVLRNTGLDAEMFRTIGGALRIIARKISLLDIPRERKVYLIAKFASLLSFLIGGGYVAASQDFNIETGVTSDTSYASENTNTEEYIQNLTGATEELANRLADLLPRMIEIANMAGIDFRASSNNTGRFRRSAFDGDDENDANLGNNEPSSARTLRTLVTDAFSGNEAGSGGIDHSQTIEPTPAPVNLEPSFTLFGNFTTVEGFRARESFEPGSNFVNGFTTEAGQTLRVVDVRRDTSNVVSVKVNGQNVESRDWYQVEIGTNDDGTPRLVWMSAAIGEFTPIGVEIYKPTSGVIEVTSDFRNSVITRALGDGYTSETSVAAENMTVNTDPGYPRTANSLIGIPVTATNNQTFIDNSEALLNYSTPEEWEDQNGSDGAGGRYEVQQTTIFKGNKSFSYVGRFHIPSGVTNSNEYVLREISLPTDDGRMITAEINEGEFVVVTIGDDNQVYIVTGALVNGQRPQVGQPFEILREWDGTHLNEIANETLVMTPEGPRDLANYIASQDDLVEATIQFGFRTDDIQLVNGELLVTDGNGIMYRFNPENRIWGMNEATLAANFPGIYASPEVLSFVNSHLAEIKNGDIVYNPDTHEFTRTINGSTERWNSGSGEWETAQQVDQPGGQGNQEDLPPDIDAASRHPGVYYDEANNSYIFSCVVEGDAVERGALLMEGYQFFDRLSGQTMTVEVRADVVIRCRINGEGSFLIPLYLRVYGGGINRVIPIFGDNVIHDHNSQINSAAQNFGIRDGNLVRFVIPGSGISGRYSSPEVLDIVNAYYDSHEGFRGSATSGTPLRGLLLPVDALPT